MTASSGWPGLADRHGGGGGRDGGAPSATSLMRNAKRLTWKWEEGGGQGSGRKGRLSAQSPNWDLVASGRPLSQGPGFVWPSHGAAHSSGAASLRGPRPGGIKNQHLHELVRLRQINLVDSRPSRWGRGSFRIIPFPFWGERKPNIQHIWCQRLWRGAVWMVLTDTQRLRTL